MKKKLLIIDIVLITVAILLWIPNHLQNKKIHAQAKHELFENIDSDLDYYSGIINKYVVNDNEVKIYMNYGWDKLTEQQKTKALNGMSNIIQRSAVEHNFVNSDKNVRISYYDKDESWIDTYK